MGDRFLLVTQNVDGLHRRAGSVRLIEIHGSLFEDPVRPLRREPSRTMPVPRRPAAVRRVRSRGHAALLRPAVVWFGEVLDPMNLQRISAFVQEARGEPPRVPRRRDLGASTGGRPRAAGVRRGRRGVARQRRGRGQGAPRSTTSSSGPSGEASPICSSGGVSEAVLGRVLAVAPAAAIDLGALERARVLAAATAFLRRSRPRSPRPPRPVARVAVTTSSPRATTGGPIPPTPAGPTCGGTASRTPTTSSATGRR